MKYICTNLEIHTDCTNSMNHTYYGVILFFNKNFEKAACFYSTIASSLSTNFHSTLVWYLRAISIEKNITHFKIKY